MSLTVTDLFCGAGGSSIGATLAGAELRMAANHWARAVETHWANFPEAHHDLADISQVDPRRYPRTDILLASPECTHHSQARTGRHRDDLFDPKGDPMAERSRATMWDVVRFAERHQYEVIVVENVTEVTRWAPFDAWRTAMESLGYECQPLFLNSLVAHPTPQSRDRIYVVFWRKGGRRPDLDIRPRAYCQTHGDVEGRQAWKNPAKQVGKFRSQYLYRCPTCNDAVAPYAYPAASAIDWSLPCQRIGDRDRPLVGATRRRIALGLERFGPGAQVVPLHHGGPRGPHPRPVWDPWPTQTGRQEHALAIPFIAELRGGGSKARPVDQPAATVTASGNHHGLVCPPGFMVKNYGDGTDPSMVFPFERPLAAVTTQDHHSVVTMPFLTAYYGHGTSSSVAQPVPTVRTHDGAALVDPRSLDLGSWTVDDCGFRMLEPHEIQRAMAFPENYRLVGNKRERVKMLGNGVTPPVMTVILERAIAALDLAGVAA